MSEQMKAALPAPDPSEALEHRVARLARTPRPSAVPRRLAFAGAALVLLGGLWMNRPHARETTDQKTPWQRPLLEYVLPGRTFRLYDIFRNTQGDVLLLYTMGKTPEDAVVTDEQGTRRLRDSSVWTQDWFMSVQGNRHPGPVTTIHLPFDATRTAISPRRVAPNGEKWEALCLSGRAPAGDALRIAYAPENLHGPALWEAARQSAEKKHGWPAFLLPLTSLRTSKELVPANWTQAGVNVAEAIRQVRRN